MKIFIALGRALKIFGLAAIVVLGVMVAMFASFVWWSSTGVFSTANFDSAAWFAPVTNETEISCYRGGMARILKIGCLSQECPYLRLSSCWGAQTVRLIMNIATSWECVAVWAGIMMTFTYILIGQEGLRVPQLFSIKLPNFQFDTATFGASQPKC